MGRNLGLVVALSVVGCAAGSKSAEQSPSSGSTGGSTQKEEGARNVESPATETTTGAPAPDFTPKGGADAPDTGAAPRDEKAADTKELGRSSAALGTTDHGELFDQLAVKIESAKLGTKASADLQTAMAGKTTDLDACYATARKSNPKLKGTIVLVFNVEPDGTVSSVTVKTSSKNKALDSCAKDAAKLLKLDKPLVTVKTKASVAIAFGG